jgi:hypothetical protein
MQVWENDEARMTKLEGMTKRILCFPVVPRLPLAIPSSFGFGYSDLWIPSSFVHSDFVIQALKSSSSFQEN